VVGTGYWASAVAGNPYYINLPNPSGAGNTLILGVSSPYSPGRTTTVSDDKGNSWQLVKSVNNGSVMSSIYAATGVAGGTTKITVTFDSALYQCQFVLSEFYNVSGIDSNPTPASGDLIYNYGYDTANASLAPGAGGPVTGISAGAGFTLLSADVMLGDYAQYAIAPATPSAVITGGSDLFNSVSVAFTTNTQGTAPGTGIRIVRVQHEMINKSGPIEFPSQGNLVLLATARRAGNINYSAVVSTPANTWVKNDQTPIPPGYDPPQVWFAQNAATAQNMSISITGTPGPNGTTFVCYDVVNAGPLDTVMGQPRAALTTSSATQLVTHMPDATPSSSGGLVFNVTGSSFGPNTSASPGILDTITYGGQVDNDLMDNADSYSHYYNPDTSLESWSMQMNGSASSSVERGIVIGFKHQ
jgi:hypothetical protein